LRKRPRALPLRQNLGGGRSHAFTIVEVMMAAVILTLVFIGLIEAVALTSSTMDHARRQILATQILNNELEELRFSSWTAISALPTPSAAVAIDRQFWPPWKSAPDYVANHVVSYNGAWYRCIAANSNQAPTNTTYWTSVTSGAATDIISRLGATFTVRRTVTSPNPITNIREVNFTVTWVVKTSRRDASNNPLSFTYSRSSSGWYGKYGLNLSYQRS